MGIASETTYFHMEVSSSIDRIERHLFRARRLREDPAELTHELSQALPRVHRLQKNLETYFRREREELFPRVQRIFGSEVEEVEELFRYQGKILAALKQFSDELSSCITARTPGHRVRLAYLDLLFEEFAHLYEGRCQVERAFHQTFSTILYPGGLSTE